MKTAPISMSGIWDRVLLMRPGVPLVAFGSAVLTLLVGKLDVESGSRVSFSILYFIPIALAAWLGGRGVGIFAALFAATVWYLAEHGGMEGGITPYLNFAVRAISFMILAGLLSEVRSLNQKLRFGLDRKTASLEREQAERRRIEKEFETFFTLSQDIFCICDFQFHLQMVNPAWVQMAQFPDWSNRKLLDFFHPDDIGHTAISLDEIRANGGSARFNGRFLRADSSFRSLEWTVTASPERRLLYIVAHDVTERVKLEKQILEVSDSECQRFGQDLHDGLCQRLKGLGMLAEAARDSVVADVAFYKARADKIATELQRAIGEARDLARGLYPVHVDAGGLRSALEELATSTRELFNVVCSVSIDPSCIPVDNATAVHLYRIAREAVSNAARHGKAASIMVALARQESQGRLSIRDDGEGFKADGRFSGMGIHTMRYRASLLGAAFEIHSKPGSGTTVSCVFNLQ